MQATVAPNPTLQSSVINDSMNVWLLWLKAWSSSVTKSADGKVSSGRGSCGGIFVCGGSNTKERLLISSFVQRRAES